MSYSAERFLNRRRLICGNNRYLIREIEFYIYSDDFKDEYTHKHPQQLTKNQWYFHRTSKDNYRAGTFKGLDITRGNGSRYFGILIRSIENIDTKEFIQGPCNVVHELMKKSNIEGDLRSISVSKLVDMMKTLDIYDDRNPFYLIKADEKFVIYKAPRYGLSDKYPSFKNKKLRFSTSHKKLKENKNFEIC